MRVKLRLLLVFGALLACHWTTSALAQEEETLNGADSNQITILDPRKVPRATSNINAAAINSLTGSTTSTTAAASPDGKVKDKTTLVYATHVTETPAPQLDENPTELNSQLGQPVYLQAQPQQQTPQPHAQSTIPHHPSAGQFLYPQPSPLANNVAAPLNAPGASPAYYSHPGYGLQYVQYIPRPVAMSNYPPPQPSFYGQHPQQYQNAPLLQQQPQNPHGLVHPHSHPHYHPHATAPGIPPSGQYILPPPPGHHTIPAVNNNNYNNQPQAPVQNPSHNQQQSGSPQTQQHHNHPQQQQQFQPQVQQQQQQNNNHFQPQQQHHHQTQHQPQQHNHHHHHPQTHFLAGPSPQSPPVPAPTSTYVSGSVAGPPQALPQPQPQAQTHAHNHPQQPQPQPQQQPQQHQHVAQATAQPSSYLMYSSPSHHYHMSHTNLHPHHMVHPQSVNPTAQSSNIIPNHVQPPQQILPLQPQMVVPGPQPQQQQLIGSYSHQAPLYSYVQPQQQQQVQLPRYAGQDDSFLNTNEYIPGVQYGAIKRRSAKA